MWYHTFFEGLPQHAWKLGQDDFRTQLEVDFLQDALGREGEGNVLDVFSGYGRHAIPLAALGYRLWCIDISKEACEELSVTAREEYRDVEVLCADFLEADLPTVEIHAAYCMGNSFSFFGRSDMLGFLKKVAGALSAGGRFVAHTSMLAESVLPQFQQRSWMEVGNEEEKILYLVDSDYDALNGVIHAEVTYVRGSERHSYRIDQWIYTLSDLSALFQEAGMELLEAYSDTSGEPFSVGDEEAYLIAEKR